MGEAKPHRRLFPGVEADAGVDGAVLREIRDGVVGSFTFETSAFSGFVLGYTVSWQVEAQQIAIGLDFGEFDRDGLPEDVSDVVAALETGSPKLLAKWTRDSILIDLKTVPPELDLDVAEIFERVSARAAAAPAPSEGAEG